MSHLCPPGRQQGMNSTSVFTTAPDVVVVGAGLAGLTAAATAARAGHSVRVIEARSSVGGQARSSTHGGFTFNRGPHALYLGGPAERILRGLDVDLRGGKPPVKGRLVFEGELEIAPAGPSTLLRTKALSPRGKLAIGKLLGRLPKLDAAAVAGLSANEWIAQSVDGHREAELLRALTRLSTYVNDPDRLSAEVAVGQLQLALSSGVLYLDGGWQSLVDQLRATAGVEFVTDEPVVELPDARSVIIATGTPDSAAQLLGTSFSVGPAAAVSGLDLGLDRAPDLDFVLGGDVPFYFSNHSAVAQLAPNGQFHAAAVQYLGPDDEPDADAIRSFAARAGVTDADIVESRRLHRMTTVTAIPTANNGGLGGRPAIDASGHPNVFLAGDWVGTDGHLADASIASGAAAAEAAVHSLEASLQR